MKKKTTKAKFLALHVRQLEASAKILEHLTAIRKSSLDKGFDTVGVSYLIDLLCLHIMPQYNASPKIVEDIKGNVQNEMIAFNASPPVRNTIEELKKAGIDFSITYDTKKKDVVPAIDVKKIKLSDAELKNWVEANFDRICDLVKEKK